MLPIFQVTGRAVWFVVSNALTLFRLCWLPIAVLLASEYAMAYAVVHASPGLSLKELEETDAFGAATLTDLLLQGLALSVVAVSVHRIILFNERRSGQYFTFPFGRTELLYVLMGALTFLALIVLFLLMTFVAGQLALLTGTEVSSLAKNPPTFAAAIGLALLGYVALMWLAMRLMPWPPAVVATNGLALGEALRLSKGNVLALFSLSLASTIAFIAIGGAVAIAAAQAGLVETLDLGKALMLEATPEARLARVAESRVNPHVIAYEFAYQFFVTTYAVAVLSYAYKALQGLDMDLPINGQPEDLPELEPGVKPMGKL